MKKFLKRINSASNQKGMSLVEVMVSAGILLAVLGGASRLVANSAKTLRTIEAVEKRNLLAKTIEEILASGSSLTASLAVAANANGPLSLCSEVGPLPIANDCLSMTSPVLSWPVTTLSVPQQGSSKGFSVKGYNVTLTNPVTKTLLAKSGAGAFYDMTGRACSGISQANAQCPFAVRAVFIPICAGNAAQCATASVFRFFYTISQDADSGSLAASKKNGNSRITVYSSFVDLTLDRVLSVQSCGVGSVPNGVDANGALQCRTSSCPAGTVLSGYDAGGAIVCAPMPSSVVPQNANVAGFAQVANFANTIKGGFCPQDQFMLGLWQDGSPRCGPMP